MVGMNPVQIRATVELYPSLRPPPILPGQGAESSKCCFSACDSTQSSSHQESADETLFIGAPTESVVAAPGLAMEMGLRNQWQSSHLIHPLYKLTKPRNFTHFRNDSLYLSFFVRITQWEMNCIKHIGMVNNTKCCDILCGKLVFPLNKNTFYGCRSLWKCQMQTRKSLQSQRGW